MDFMLKRNKVGELSVEQTHIQMLKVEECI